MLAISEQKLEELETGKTPSHSLKEPNDSGQNISLNEHDSDSKESDKLPNALRKKTKGL